MIVQSARLATLVFLLPTFACAFGRTARGPSPWPAVPATESPATAPRKFIVAQFYEFETATSQTQSVDIVTIRESASIKDISGELATALTQSGASAVGKSGFDGKNMGPNDLWVRGVARYERTQNGAAVASWIVTGVTLGVIGLLLPLPFPIGHGAGYGLRIEVVNAQGDLVMTRDDRIAFDYTSIHTLGMISEDSARDRAEMLTRLAGGIATLGK